MSFSDFKKLRAYHSIALITAFVCLVSCAPVSADSIAYLPAGKWEEKAGSAKLHILNSNRIRFAFSGELPSSTCEIRVNATVRTEYFGTLDCEGIRYNRAIFYFNYDSKELELTFIQNRAFFQTYIFVPEGTIQPPPEI